MTDISSSTGMVIVLIILAFVVFINVGLVLGLRNRKHNTDMVDGIGNFITGFKETGKKDSQDAKTLSEMVRSLPIDEEDSPEKNS